MIIIKKLEITKYEENVGFCKSCIKFFEKKEFSEMKSRGS